MSMGAEVYLLTKALNRVEHWANAAGKVRGAIRVDLAQAAAEISEAAEIIGAKLYRAAQPPQRPGAQPATCPWLYVHGEGYWTSACGHHEVSTDSRYTFCPFCGVKRAISFAPGAEEATKP